MEKFTEFQTYVLYLLTKEFLNGDYDSLKNLEKEIIALAKNMNYKEFHKKIEYYNRDITTLEFYNDEDKYLDYSIVFNETFPFSPVCTS